MDVENANNTPTGSIAEDRENITGSANTSSLSEKIYVAGKNANATAELKNER